MAGPELKAKLGLDNQDFLDGLTKGNKGLAEFGKSFISTAGAIGVAVTALKMIKDWFLDTDYGAAQMNATLAVSKQLFSDLITGQKMNLRETIRISNAKSAEIADESKEQYEAAKLQSELNTLIKDAADQTISLTEKKNLLNKAMEKEKELKSFLLTEARKDLQNAYDSWQQNIASITAKNEYYKAAKRVVEIEGMDSRRLMSQYTGTLEEQTKRANELVDAFTKIPEAIKEINNTPINPTSTGKPKVNIEGAALPKGVLSEAPVQMKSITKELSSQQEALLQLSDSFGSFFSNVDQGFQGMIDGVMKGIQRLVAELIAKAAVLAILSAITGVPMPSLKNLLPGGMQNFIKSGAGESIGVESLGVGQTVNVIGRISGKDLALVMRRNG